jgi:hypothetical protein
MTSTTFLPIQATQRIEARQSIHKDRSSWEVAMVRVGDRVVLESEKVGQEPQAGVVTGTEGHLLKVRWDSGKESSFIPSAGSLQVVGRGSEEGQSDRR